MFRPGLNLFRATAVRPLRTHVPSRAYRQQRFGDTRPRSGRQFIGGFFLRWATRPTFYRDVGIITAGAAGIYLYNLEEVPISGRRRFNIISPATEAWMGKSTVDAIMEEYKGKFLPECDPRVTKVKKVLDRLIPFAERAGLGRVEWEVQVIASPEKNAFVAPGGKVFVFTGILPICGDEDGIAAVLGHELAHVVAHHSAERLSQSPLIGLALIALLSIDFSFYTSMMLLNVFLSWPGSRKQEAEADYIGLLMMAEGCYRPEAAMELWSRMEQQARGQSPPQLLSTHPSNHNREEKIKEWLPKAREKAQAAQCHITSTYADQFTAAFQGKYW